MEPPRPGTPGWSRHLAHVLIGEPVSTSPEHALTCHCERSEAISARLLATTAGSADGVCRCRLADTDPKSRERAVASHRQKPSKPAQPKPEKGRSQAADDDTVITALGLKEAAPTDAMAAYFNKCEEKLGFVPNVLRAYAFDMPKLEAFVAMYNDLMLAPSGLSKLEREMIAVAVSSVNRCYYCLTAHGAAVRALSDDPVLGELMVMNYRAARLSPRERAMLDFAVKLTAEPWAIEEGDREALRQVGFSARDIWDIAAVAGFFNMSNRVASATDMRPNSVYHSQSR
jgi:uncharacterized peroxidase-related enzyme